MEVTMFGMQSHAIIDTYHTGRASNSNFVEQIIGKNKSNFNRAGNKRVFFFKPLKLLIH